MIEREPGIRRIKRSWMPEVTHTDGNSRNSSMNKRWANNASVVGSMIFGFLIFTMWIRRLKVSILQAHGNVIEANKAFWKKSPSVKRSVLTVIGFTIGKNLNECVCQFVATVDGH